MERKQITSKEFFNGLSIVFYALIIGLVFFALVSFYLQQNNFGKTEMNIFKYIVPIFIYGAFRGGSILFKKQVNNAIPKTDLLEKLILYRSALIVKYALLEGAAFFAIVAYLLTGEVLHLALAGISILAFLFSIPSIAKTENDLELNQDERQKINNPETVLSV